MTSKLYISPGNPTVWSHAGADRLLDARGLTFNGGVACGALLDLGPAPRADRYEVELFVDGFSDGDPNPGGIICVYFLQSADGVNFDGPPTTAPTVSTEGTVTLAQSRHGKFAAAVQVVSTTRTDPLRGRRVLRLTSRYVAPVVVNFADEVLGVTGNHSVTLREMPYESQ
jgi:hypothetical protein